MANTFRLRRSDQSGERGRGEEKEVFAGYLKLYSKCDLPK